MVKMKKTNISDDKEAIIRLNKCLSQSLALFDPPRQISVSQWAKENRILTDNAEAGPWRNERTPYLVEPMDSFSDHKINRIILVACSQAGKSEMILNCIGYLIDNDPCVIMLVEPTLGQVKKFSKLRITPLLKNTKCLKRKIRKLKSTAKVNNTVLEKEFPGGMLIMVGTQSAGDLASTPVKVAFGDERDRHKKNVGNEGDPWELIKARQVTFRKEAKNVEVSSPTVKGDSAIVSSYEEGTQALWLHKCPICGEWHEILFKDIRFTYTKTISENKKEPTYRVDLKGWACPSCGTISSEKVMKKQPQKWFHRNPEAFKEGIVSYWIKGFANGFANWSNICLAFLHAKNDPIKLQAFTNTILGELWEDRGDIGTDDEYLNRREDYGAELPDGVLCLTAGIDTQDDRFEYEILGHSRYNEEYVIEYGQIIGKPNDPETWKQLDDRIFDRVFKFKNGKGLKVSLSFVDSGGHYTKDVYTETLKRRVKHVFAIKGKGGDYPYVNLPSKVKVDYGNRVVETYLYIIGVDAGKAQIMSSLKTQTPGANYVHFPIRPEAGCSDKYFNGLLSEHPVWKGAKWVWEKLPGHRRNEPLDCHNYAKAAEKVLKPNYDAIENRLREVSMQNNGVVEIKQTKVKPVKRGLRTTRSFTEEW